MAVHWREMELCVPCERPPVLLKKPVVLSSGPQGFLAECSEMLLSAIVWE